MDCNTYREALSALLDGESSPIPEEQVEAHVAECPACRSWQRRATALTRAMRLRPAEPTPDLARSVLDAAGPLLRRRRARRWPRVLLGCVAVCQLALGAAQALGWGHGGHEHAAGEWMAGHLFNESTSWNLALGLGMLWTAWRVRASSGLLPVLTAFLVVLTGFSIGDLVGGAVTVDRLATHGLLVLGLVLLLVVHRDHARRPGDRPPGDTRGSGRAGPPAPFDDPAAEDVPRFPEGRRDLGPTGHRRAG
ncbi:zf-HC2 domain-containing protein [Saccharopolyspora rosea]|uniref:Zf-HC2 domain-containing protein n=1 Tax=Saccharopolyspora rosea TaxID=524884 RepID=A0ABW3FLU4_9PSEU|nr:zf-HC2 domain-containing protein [Saccharopolyspora rosea]